jgi:M6 family metalloprotease-like protein
MEKYYDVTVDIGFPNNGSTPSVGIVNVKVLFFDFPDVEALNSPELYMDLFEEYVQDFYAETSYGKLTVNFQPHYEWFRLTKTSEAYGDSIRGSTAGYISFLEEVIFLADDDVDFSECQVLLVITSSGGSTLSNVARALSPPADSAVIVTQDNVLRSAITTDYRIRTMGGRLVAHELGHSLGLIDLYGTDADSKSLHTGEFGIMGDGTGSSPGFFAYERWLLGWLDDAQVHCLVEGTVEIRLQQLATEGGTKAVSIPINNKRSIVVESRRSVGVDASHQDEGLLVYEVDTSEEFGMGFIKVISQVKNDEDKEFALLKAGEVIKHLGVTIEVIESTETSDLVRVSVE